MQTFIFRCLYQEHKLVISVYLSQCFSAQSEIGNRKPGNLMLCELVFRSHKISDTTWTSFEAKQLKTIHTPQFWLKLFSNNFYDKCVIKVWILNVSFPELYCTVYSCIIVILSMMTVLFVKSFAHTFLIYSMCWTYCSLFITTPLIIYL